MQYVLPPLEQAASDFLQLTLRGWKVGATNPATQARVGLNQPFYGPIFSADLMQAPATLEDPGYLVRGVEAEFCFVMAKTLDVRDQSYSTNEVIAAVDHVYPAIEVVGSRFQPVADVPPELLVADQAGHGSLVTARHLKVSPQRYVGSQHIYIYSQMVHLHLQVYR